MQTASSGAIFTLRDLRVDVLGSFEHQVDVPTGTVCRVWRPQRKRHVSGLQLSVDFLNPHLRKEMTAFIRPSHLTLLGHAQAHHLVDCRLCDRAADGQPFVVPPGGSISTFALTEGSAISQPLTTDHARANGFTSSPPVRGNGTLAVKESRAKERLAAGCTRLCACLAFSESSSRSFSPSHCRFKGRRRRLWRHADRATTGWTALRRRTVIFTTTVNRKR